MIQYYKTLTDFELPSDIVSDIKNLDQGQLEAAMISDRFFYIKVLREEGFSWFEIVKWFMSYGWLFSKTGTLSTYKLPLDIEHRISEFLKNSVDSSADQNLFLRLQVIYNGSLVPLHVDRTRSASIIYPIDHSQPAVTKFYKAIGQARRGLCDPTQCEQVDSVLIKHIPVLLNVDEIHSVEYTAGSITKDCPRISLAIKWENRSAAEIELMFAQ